MTTKTLDQMIKEAEVKYDPNAKRPKMCKPDGIKFCVERKDGAITTWTDIYDRPAVEILKSVIKDKNWKGGKLTDADIHTYAADGTWFREALDISPKSALQKVLK